MGLKSVISYPTRPDLTLYLPSNSEYIPKFQRSIQQWAWFPLPVRTGRRFDHLTLELTPLKRQRPGEAAESRATCWEATYLTCMTFIPARSGLLERLRGYLTDAFSLLKRVFLLLRRSFVLGGTGHPMRHNGCSGVPPGS